MNKVLNLLSKITPMPVKQVWRKHLQNKRDKKEYIRKPFLSDNDAFLASFFPEANSQFSQDVFVLNILFGGKNDGFFLDIGANEPIDINNSLLLEKSGWEGLAFEPIPHLAEKWKVLRKTECINVAVGDSEGEVQFTETPAHVLSGVNVEAKDGKKYTVKQRTLTNMLKERGITQVDVCFIDVEGYEKNVLDGLSFREFDIKCFCIENGEVDESLRQIMVDNGYTRIARLSIDDVFMKNEYLPW